METSRFHPLDTPERQRDWMLQPSTTPHQVLMEWPGLKAHGLPLDVLEAYREQARHHFRLELPAPPETV